MHLEELRTLLLSERETGRLTGVPPEIFESTKKELAELTSDVYANEDPFSDRTRVLIERASSIRETMQDLFRIRAEKILALAASHIEGQLAEKDELKKMLPIERGMFDSVTSAISHARCELVDTSHEKAPAMHPGKVSPCISGEPGEMGEDFANEDAPVAGQGYVLARVLDSMEPFLGVDGRIYHLEKEDIVTLPKRNAEVLHERNIVIPLKPPSVP